MILGPLTEYILPETDLYHSNHPFHWLVLEEIEEYELVMELDSTSKAHVDFGDKVVGVFEA
jgi:hypothetical protein